MKNKADLFYLNIINCVFLIFGTLVFAQEPQMNLPVSGAAAVAHDESPVSQEETKEEEEFFDLKSPFVSFLPRENEPQAEPIEWVSTDGIQNAPQKEESFDYSSLQITGLVWGIQEPKAIINDEVLGIGDEINNGKIVDISKDGILFSYDNEEFFIKRSIISGVLRESN